MIIKEHILFQFCQAGKSGTFSCLHANNQFEFEFVFFWWKNPSTMLFI